MAGLNHPSTVTNQAHCWASFVTTVGLDYQRATFGWKCADLDAAGLAATVAASTMTLGGMLKHLALVEDQWFSWFLHGAHGGAVEHGRLGRRSRLGLGHHSEIVDTEELSASPGTMSGQRVLARGG